MIEETQQSPDTRQPKERHGCLTAYLIVMIIANSGTALVYLLKGDIIRESLPNLPSWGPALLILSSLFNFICAIALFCWKKWGFWGFTASAICIAVFNHSVGIGIGSIVSGLAGVAILYGVLQIGAANKGWDQLE